MRDSEHASPRGSPRTGARSQITRPWLVCACTYLLLCGLAGPAAAQRGTLGGIVVEEASQRPIVGAQVLLVGTTRGTVTDANGRFRLELESAATDVPLRVVMLGYRTVNVNARMGDTNLRIALTETAIEFDAVVVTGTAGGTRKRALGNDVSQVSVSKVMDKAPVSDVQQLLGPRVAGLVIMAGSGNVGTGTATRIRGVSSLSLSNEPLIYIDGVRMNNDPSSGPNIRQGRQVNRLNDINPEDIESIEVIKGPAAATLYGTEASRGVIQIITKKGASGKATIDFVVQQGANWIANLEDKVPVVYGRNAARELVSVNLLEQEKLAGRNPFQNGHIQSYSASLRGGTDQIRYYVSADWDNSEGVVSYNWQKKLNTRGSLNLLLSEKVDASANVAFISGKTRFAQAASGWGVWDQFVWGSPLTVNTRTRGFLRATPEVVAEIEAFSDIDRFTGGFQLNHRPAGWLAQRLTLGLDNGDETNSILFPRHPDGSAYFFGGLSLGQKSVERRKSTFATLDYSATATSQLSSRIAASTSGGVQYYTKTFENVDALGQQFPAPPVTTVSGAAVTFAGEDFIQNKTLGVFLQQQLSLDSRLFLTAAVRGDDNSAFGENYDAVIYPKVSASWVVSEEPFWKLKAVNSLKARAAWGQAGQQPDVFAAIRLYSPATGPGDGSVLTPQTIGNPDLAPEKGEELELGFDAALFGDRAALTFTYYSQHTRDAIVQKPVMPSLGFPGSQFVNLGEVSNRGIEVGLDARVLEGARVGWELGFKVSTNTNNVVSLGGLPPVAMGVQQHKEGFPVAAFFQKKVVSASLDASGRAINILCDGGPGVQPMDCANAPRVYWGTPTPRWEGAVSTTLTLLRNLRVYALVDFRGGHMIQNGDINAAHTTFRNSLPINEATDPILMAYDRLGVTDPTGFLDAGFAKLREVSATYTLSDAMARRFGASRASLTVGARNVATLWVAQDDVFGQPIPDPEVRTPGSNLSGYVQTVLPPYSQLLTTIRLAF
jgi:TonB-linked SusC/RagA family outer membrane protein